MMGALVILGFIILLGSIFGWIAFFSNRQLNRKLEDLYREVRRLRKESAATGVSKQPMTGFETVDTAAKPDFGPPVDKEVKPDGWKPVEIEQPDPVKHNVSSSIPAYTDSTDFDWTDHLKNNWMIWLGGACIGLAGIFLTKYSIDQGYLGPGARITAGIILGIVLHVAAERLRRGKEYHPAFAALAAGGSITMFAALLSALHLFHMFNPGIVFFALALVALATMALAIYHGPVLAIIGILGAYLVPLMVGGGPGNALIVLGYTTIISAAALLLLRFVYREWLWLGVVAGGLGWWLLTIMDSDVDGLRGVYLTVFAYLMIAVPTADWFLKQTREGRQGEPFIKRYFVATNRMEGLLPASLLLVILCQCFSIAFLGYTDSMAVVNWTPLAVLLCISAGRRNYLGLHPWILLILSIVAWLLSRYDFARFITFNDLKSNSFYWYCGITAFTYSALALFNIYTKRDRPLWVSLAVLAPLLFLSLAYVLTEKLDTSLNWSIIAAILGAFYLGLAATTMNKLEKDIIPAWLIIGGHLGYSLAVAMYFRQASMTLALAAQVVTLSWVISRFQLASIGWLLKIVVAIVITRLTLNPWLLSYPTDVHWSLWTYGGSTVCCLLGGLLLRSRPQLQMWAYGATVHLLALTVWAETRYWLYDGNVYAAEYKFIEAVINQNIFAVMGLVYYFRERFSQALAKLYRIYSMILISFATLNFSLIVAATLFSKSWIWANVGNGKIFNILLLAFGTPVVLGYLVHRFYLPGVRKFAAIFTAVSLFIFVSLEIRHLWQGHVRLSIPALDTELYTYSAVWLVIAVAATLGGIWRFGRECYRAGMLLLVVVIAKLFLVDMDGLEGLLRVASFMGMGLALLGIAYLHQRLNRNV